MTGSRAAALGVHRRFDGRVDRRWDDEPRHDRLIAIGRHLDRASPPRGADDA